MHKTYVGIDPGDRWCGWAILSVQNGLRFKLQAGVIDRKPKTFVQTVKMLVPPPARRIATERYQLRQQGFNTFSTGDTLQLIGAIRFRAEEHEIEWAEVATANPDIELPKLMGERFFSPWFEKWEDPARPYWQHARSALRVVLYERFINDTDLVRNLRRSTLDAVSRQVAGHLDEDHVAPAAIWSLV